MRRGREPRSRCILASAVFGSLDLTTPSACPPRTDIRSAEHPRPLLCKVKMSLGSLAGSVSRRRGDLHIAAAPASAVGFWARFGGAGPGPRLKPREHRSET